VEEVLPFENAASPMSSHAPFEAVAQSERFKRMTVHLEQHRSELCGVDMLASAAARYVSEIYPAGDDFATNCTRTAVAVFVFLTGRTDLLSTCETRSLLGAPCPVAPTSPQVLYLSLVESGKGRFDTSSGHRLVVLLAKGRARVMHAFNERFLLAEHMRSTGSMAHGEFVKWWGRLQGALRCDAANERAMMLDELLGPVGFAEPVGGSWMCSAGVDIGV
jgi:hypothetical protein